MSRAVARAVAKFDVHAVVNLDPATLVWPPDSSKISWVEWADWPFGSRRDTQPCHAFYVYTKNDNINTAMMDTRRDFCNFVFNANQHQNDIFFFKKNTHPFMINARVVGKSREVYLNRT